MSAWDRDRARKTGRLAQDPQELRDALDEHRATVAAAEAQAAAEAAERAARGEQLDLFA